MYPKKINFTTTIDYTFNEQVGYQFLKHYKYAQILCIPNIQFSFLIKSLQEYTLASQKKNNTKLSSRVEAQKQNTNNTKQGAWKD